MFGKLKLINPVYGFDIFICQDCRQFHTSENATLISIFDKCRNVTAGELWKLEENKTDVKVGLAKAGGRMPYGNSLYTYIESSNEGVDKYDFKMSIYLNLKENSTSFLDEGNKYKSAYLEKDFSCPFINF